jgi:predicted MFS family arabinose efflux permease
VWTAIVVSLFRDGGGNLAFPGWISMTGEMVPIEGRGRYFGSRNFVYGIVGMAITLLSGELITQLGSPRGYQVALAAAFVIGSGATYSFSRLKDPRDGRPVRAEGAMSLRGALKDIWGHPAFVALCLVMGLWNFSLNLAGPFFNVRMVQDLKFTATMVGLTSIASTVSSLLVQRKMGEIADRLGPRRVQVLCMLLIPILPAMWVFITQLWQVLALNIFGGALWGAFGLVSFNFLLTLTPEAQRARYSAVYQIFITVSLAAGAATGAWIISQWSYPGVFLGSATGRMIAAILFVLFVPAAEKMRPILSAEGVKP